MMQERDGLCGTHWAIKLGHQFTDEGRGDDEGTTVPFYCDLCGKLESKVVKWEHCAAKQYQFGPNHLRNELEGLRDEIFQTDPELSEGLKGLIDSMINVALNLNNCIKISDLFNPKHLLEFMERVHHLMNVFPACPDCNGKDCMSWFYQCVRTTLINSSDPQGAMAMFLITLRKNNNVLYFDEDEFENLPELGGLVIEINKETHQRRVRLVEHRSNQSVPTDIEWPDIVGHSEDDG